MNSPFKFLRRVRIHGGECGAVARALHHEAKTQSLPAVEENVFFTTSERKIMSIKTAYKRIALIAVTALGFGLLSSAPSQAAYDANNSSMSCTAVGRVGVGIEFLVKSTGSVTNGFEFTNATYIQAQLTDAPAAAGLVAPEAAYASTGLASSTSALRNDSITANQITAHNLGGYARFLLNAEDGDSYLAGTYNFLLWATTTAGAVPAKYASGNASCRVSVTLAGAPAAFTLAASSASADSSTVANTAIEATITDAAGNATLLTGTETFTVGANTGTANAKEAFLSDTAGASAIYTSAAGRGALGVMDSGTAVVKFDAGRVNVDLPVQHRNKIQAWVGASKAGTQAFVIKGAGPLVGLSSTFTLTTTSRPLIDRITPSGGTLFGGTRVDSTSLTVRNSSYATLSNSMIGTLANASIDPTAIELVSASSATSKTVNFQLDLSTTGLVKGTVAAITTTTPIPAGVASGAFDFTSDTTSVVKAFTATAPNPGEGYVVTFNMGDNKFVKYQVNYVAQQLTSSIGTLTTNLSSGARAATGSTVSVAVTAKDGFGTVISGATIRLTHNRTSTGVSSDVLTATTDASGVATFSITDARTDFSTTVRKNSTGTFTITGSTANASTSASVSSGNTVAYTAEANLTPGAIAITETADDDDNVGNVVDAVINETITVTTDTGAVMAGVAYTATISGGLYERKTYANPVSQLTGFTDSNGYAFIRVAGYQTGVATVTFTVGSLSKSDTFTVVSAASKLRALSVDKTTAAINSGDTGYVTVTAKDIYGNVVPSAALTISYVGTSGRVVSFNGAQANTATTNASGQVVVGILADGTGTGTLTAEYSGAVAASVTTTTQGVAPIARVASVSTAVTTSGVSAAVAAAEAATDAAAEAIDAANAATDAANLAAEAADAATVAAEEARDAADAATAAVEELATQVATLMAALKAQITTLANTVAKIAKKVKA